MFSALSENPTYFKDKVPIAVMLGPVTKISHSSNELLQYAKKFYVEISDTLWLFGIHELLGHDWLTSSAIKSFCNKLTSFCMMLERVITQDPDLDDPDRFAVYMGHQPNGTSVKSILHYAQNMREDRF